MKRADRHRMVCVDSEVVDFVGRILSAKQHAPSEDVKAVEHEIDCQVHALYPPSSRSRSASGLRRTGGLTPEEIKIVEGVAQ